MRVLVGDAENLLINLCLRHPLPLNKTHPSFVLMLMDFSVFLCLYSKWRWHSGILAPIMKDILFLVVDVERSWICGSHSFVKLSYTLEKGMLRSFTTHTFDNFIGFGCEDEDNWKLTSFDSNVFVADIALDRFSWQLILYYLNKVAISLSMTVECAPESKRAFTVTVLLFFEILTAITCNKEFSWLLIPLLTVFITVSEVAWLSVDVGWSWCKRMWCLLLHSLHLTFGLKNFLELF